MERSVVVLTGISAAGKSTVADLLARRFERGVHLRGDVFRKMIVRGRADMTPDASPEALSQLRLRYRMATRAADEYFDAGFGVVVQDVVLGPMLPEYVGMIASRPLLLVVLVPRADIVKAREQTRPKTAYGAGRHAIHDLDRTLREDTPGIGLWLDTSDQTPDETVARILERAPTEGRIH